MIRYHSQIRLPESHVLLKVSPSIQLRGHNPAIKPRLQARRRCMPSTECGNYGGISTCSYTCALTLTYLGTKGATLMSTTRRPSTPNTRNRESTHASSALRPIFAVPDMCHELAVLLRMCSYDRSISISGQRSRPPCIRTHIASSESSAGTYVFNVFSTYTDADRSRFVTLIPSMRTRRSKEWLKKLGSIKGAVEGSFECSRTAPLLCGFMIRQMAPRNSVPGSATCPTNDGGVCCHAVSMVVSSELEGDEHVLWRSRNLVL
jgi:hypothetical protein